MCVCPQGGCLVWGGACSRWGCLLPGRGACSGGVCSGGGCLLQGGCLLLGRGAWWRPPPDGDCCGQYSCHWNAFLLEQVLKRRGPHFNVFDLTPCCIRVGLDDLTPLLYCHATLVLNLCYPLWEGTCSQETIGELCTTHHRIHMCVLGA